MPVQRLDWIGTVPSGDAPSDPTEQVQSSASPTCTTQGALSWNLAPAGDALYFLVVPTNGVTEGSYGPRSDGSERPAGLSTCRDRDPGACN